MKIFIQSIIALSFLAWAADVKAQGGGPRPPGGTGGTGGGTTTPAPTPTTPRPTTGQSGGGGRVSVPYSRGQYAGTIGYTRISVRGSRLAVRTNSTRVARINLRAAGRIQISTGGGTTPPAPGGGGGMPPKQVGMQAPGPGR